MFLKDMDGDHRVSFKDFQEAIKLENLLLQGFGQCLPDDKVDTVSWFQSLFIQMFSFSQVLYSFYASHVWIYCYTATELYFISLRIWYNVIKDKNFEQSSWDAQQL